MNTFSDLVESARRLAILRALAAAGEYTLPESVARQALSHDGITASGDQMASSCAWLDEQRLLIRQAVGATAILTLTGRGLDVSEGTAVVPGVDRPRPGH